MTNWERLTAHRQIPDEIASRIQVGESIGLSLIAAEGIEEDDFEYTSGLEIG